MPLSIFETHTKILGVIPTTEQSLIYDLKTFVQKTKDSDKKHAYTDYLRVFFTIYATNTCQKQRPTLDVGLPRNV